ncbi:hypothetical protein L3V79_07825 [Thiotrichales bacterium 19S9-12]|nr:hypothetical protein [Thiotrichales bacterium 19S9-11]MCF6812261.1 hypothetical protein [Thiotrichales bacterium 19S9-12]
MTSTFEAFFDDLSKGQERTWYQRFLTGLEKGQADAIYLAQSVVSYIEDITGEEFDPDDPYAFFPMLGIFFSFAVLGALRTHSQLRTSKEFNKLYSRGRDVLSAIKNGRHAFVNILDLTSKFTNQNYASTLISPLGSIGFAIGILLIANNLYKRHLEDKRTENLNKLDQFMINPDKYSYDDVKPPKYCDRNKLVITSVIDGLTDGLYVAGNIFMLLSLFGLSAACPPLAIGMAIFYGLYTIGSVIQKYCKEKTTQLNEDKQYLNFLKKLDNENKLTDYHEKYKDDSNYKKFLGEFDHIVNADSLEEALKEKINDKETQLKEKERKLKANPIYKVYEKINKPFTHVRDYVNCIKNSLAASAGITMIVKQEPLAEATVMLGAVIAGAVLALPFLAYKTYRLFKPNSKPPNAENINLNEMISLFKSYNDPKIFKHRSHAKPIQDIINKYTTDNEESLNNTQKPISCFAEVHNYIINNYHKINKQGDLYRRYLSAKTLITKKFSSFDKALDHFIKYENNPNSDEAPITEIKSLISLYPKIDKESLPEKLSVFNPSIKLQLLAGLNLNIKNELFNIFEKNINEVPEKSKDYFLEMLTNCYLINKNKKPLTTCTNIIIKSKNLFSSPDHHISISDNFDNTFIKDIKIYLTNYQSLLLKKGFIPLEEKLNLYEQKLAIFQDDVFLKNLYNYYQEDNESLPVEKITKFMKDRTLFFDPPKIEAPPHLFSISSDHYIKPMILCA